MGDTTFSLGGIFYAWDENNELFAEMRWKYEEPKKSGGFFSSMNPFAKKPPPIPKDIITGTIYRVQEDFLDRFLSRQQYDKSGLNPNEDIIEKLADIDAMWTKYVKIGNLKDKNCPYYWRMNKEFPPELFDSDRKLPSDSAYRLDLMHWNLKDAING